MFGQIEPPFVGDEKGYKSTLFVVGSGSFYAYKKEVQAFAPSLIVLRSPTPGVTMQVTIPVVTSTATGGETTGGVLKKTIGAVEQDQVQLEPKPILAGLSPVQVLLLIGISLMAIPKFLKQRNR